MSDILAALIAVSRPADAQRLRSLGQQTSFFIDRQWLLRERRDFLVTDRSGSLTRHGANGFLAFIDAMDNMTRDAVVVYVEAHELASYFVADRALYTLYLLVWALKAHRQACVQGILNDLSSDDDRFRWRDADASVLWPYVQRVTKLAEHVPLLDVRADEMRLPEAVLYLACAFHAYEAASALIAHRWCKYSVRLVFLEIIYRAIDASQHSRVVIDLAPLGGRFSAAGKDFLKRVARPHPVHVNEELDRLVHTWSVVKAAIARLRNAPAIVPRSIAREVDALLTSQ